MHRRKSRASSSRRPARPECVTAGYVRRSAAPQSGSINKTPPTGEAGFYGSVDGRDLLLPLLSQSEPTQSALPETILTYKKLLSARDATLEPRIQF